MQHNNNTTFCLIWPEYTRNLFIHVILIFMGHTDWDAQIPVKTLFLSVFLWVFQISI